MDNHEKMLYYHLSNFYKAHDTALALKIELAALIAKVEGKEAIAVLERIDNLISDIQKQTTENTKQLEHSLHLD